MLQVKQGNSGWHEADRIRRKIRELAEFGIYIKFGRTAEGPFTLTKAYELLRSIGSDGLEVRTGARAAWVSAVHWLAKIQELQQKDARDMELMAAAVRRAANGTHATKRR
jgi:hypothetical protein